MDGAARDSSGRWVRGTSSPNPGGRPRVTPLTAAEKAQPYVDEMIEIAVSIARHGEDDGHRIQALRTVLNRALGKELEVIHLRSGDRERSVPLDSLGIDELRALHAVVVSRREGDGGG